ncbi:MAG: sensor histidine kinase [Micromonosporaceae bacterium]|nr:sensor histidine kinase [Micromonosporaceae bacterium]
MAPGRDGQPGTGQHEWRRFRAGWHGAFVGLGVLTAGLTLLMSGTGTATRVAVPGMVAVLLGWYAVAGVRGVHRRPGWVGPAYLALAVPLTVAVFALVPVGALLLVALYPHVWMMLPPRPAVVVTCAIVAAVGAVILANGPLDGRGVTSVLLLSVVSVAVAVAIGLWIARIIRQSRQRAELIAQLAQTRAQLAVVSREAGALAERERLSRDIHDTLAQGFASVLLLLEAAQTALASAPSTAAGYLGRAQQTARENLAEARSLVAALAPPDLAGTSLPEALRRLVERVGGDDGPGAELSITGTPRGLPIEREVALLRMAQESLTNVHRHAGATRVEVALVYTVDRVSLRVSDDGKGFDPAVPQQGYGLAGIRARAQGIGGVATIEAAPGAGAVVRIDVPAAGG